MILFEGKPVEIQYEAGLRDMAGNKAQAATFIPRRRILLDVALRGKAGERDRVLLHELFHFVWVRLGNPRRRGWEELLRGELAERARGEAGWSAEWRKRELRAGDAGARTRRWREYCCESFCDTGAWVYGLTGGKKKPRECTLGSRRLAKRAALFRNELGEGPFPI